MGAQSRTHAEQDETCSDGGEPAESSTEEREMKTITLTRSQLETWAGRPLSDDDLDRLALAIVHSSIPDAINEIVAGFDD